MGSIRRDLADWAQELRETHISLVFLRGSDVYKVKKPVSLGFLDFSSIDRRRAACDAEVELNRRLAPDVYLDVVPVTRDASGAHTIAGDGEIVDWAVHMRRLPDEQRADERLAAERLSVEDVDRLAEHVAAFHAEAASDADIARFGAPEAIARNVRQNFEQTRDTVRDHIRPEEAAEIERWQTDFLAENEALFGARIEQGHVRDGHGDLRLEHVYLEGADIRIIDCIEFNERFRYADVCADIAFTSMDLAWHGRVDLAERLLSIYARRRNDYDLYALVDFYESYRAHVRAKVASMLAADPEADAAVRARADREARRYYRLALAAERPSLIPPMVLAIGGIIASGKSTIADRLSLSMGGPSINTDWVRKLMAGATPTTKLYEGAWSGAYDPAFTERVYREVDRSARVVVRSGRPVILDASFRSGSTRQDARRLAQELGVPFRFVECRADPELCRQRLRERALGESVSDGRLEIFDSFLAKWEPVTELPAGEHIVLDTAQPLDANLGHLRNQLPTWPPRVHDRGT